MCHPICIYITLSCQLACSRVVANSCGFITSSDIPSGICSGNIQGYRFLIFVSDVDMVSTYAHARTMWLTLLWHLSLFRRFTSFFIFNQLMSYFIFSIFLFVNRRWDKFEDSYRVMMFSNGDKCWNGPDRSLKVLTANASVFFNKDDSLSPDSCFRWLRLFSRNGLIGLLSKLYQDMHISGLFIRLFFFYASWG